MSKNILLIGAVAAVAVVMMNKARAQVAPAGSASAPVQTVNVQNQMWSQLLGGAWKSLTTAKNPDGSPAFLMKNMFGQITTSDGKVVSDEVAELFPYTYGLGDLSVDIGAPSNGVDYLGLMGW